MNRCRSDVLFSSGNKKEYRAVGAVSKPRSVRFFVERLQGTILHEHWRVEFCRHYFTSARALQRSLDRFLAFYNRQRPHRGYRLRGRTPATVFRGAIAA